MQDNWYTQIQSKVFTQVEYMMKKKYPYLFCTTKDENTFSDNGLPTDFPTLYLQELQTVETGQDLTNESVNAIISTIEIHVWTDTTETECRDIISDALLEMKKMHFNIVGMPFVEANDKIAWGVIRCRRIIGNGDRL